MSDPLDAIRGGLHTYLLGEEAASLPPIERPDLLEEHLRIPLHTDLLSPADEDREGRLYFSLTAEDRATVERCLTRVQEDNPGMGPGEALALICYEWHDHLP